MTIDTDAPRATATEPVAIDPAPPPATDKAAPEPGKEQDPPTEGQEAAKPKPPDLRDRAIRQLAFEQRETKRQLKEAQDRLAQAQPKDPNAPLAQADVDRLIDERAKQIVAEREQTAKTEAWIAAGNVEFPDFTAKCNEIADLGGNTPAFVTAIGRVPAGHKVIAELAGNPAEAVRILNLPPVEMALELAGIAHRMATPAVTEPEPKPLPKVSNAPAPIRPLTATARTEVNPENMTSEQYQTYWNEKTRPNRRR